LSAIARYYLPQEAPMPFTDLAGHPIDRLPLLYRLGRDFQLTRAFLWEDPRDAANVITIPENNTSKPPGHGNGTDFASVPPFLWGLIASYGKQTLPSILHDHLAAKTFHLHKDKRLEFRRTADETFRTALVESGVSQLLARVMWVGVGVERYARHAGWLGVLFITQFVVGGLGIIAAVVLGVLLGPWWYLLALAPAALAIPWWRNYVLMLAGNYLGAIYFPLVIAAYVAAQLEELLALLVWLFSGFRGSRPRTRPTLRWPKRAAMLAK
jgi:hypothetical protein